MTSTQQQSILNAADCEVVFDNTTRQLYATDASIYQIEPMAVAFPRTVRQAGNVIKAAAAAGLSIIPRGAGTGLAGGALGEGLVVDFARHNQKILDFNKEKSVIRVGAGVVLDQLNDYLRPYKLRFGPDVATSSRATIGGMIANNSSGAHTPVYGTTADHVISMELVLASGGVVKIGPDHDTLGAQRDTVDSLVHLNSYSIQERMPAGLLKRWPGYGLDRWLRQPGNLVDILCGSEGTLAGIMSAELKVVPLPSSRGLGLLFFDSVAEAMQATVELLDLKPAAVEHVDRILFDQTRSQRAFQPARDLLDLDDRPCESILVVEFFDDAETKLAMLARRRMGSRQLILADPGPMSLVWSLRKAGLSLLTARKGPAKPATCIEDTAVFPAKLPEYVRELRKIFTRLGLRGSFYGHAASGLLHVRPVLDLHTMEDVKRLRQVSDEVSALVRQFNGSLAGEHGVGIARTEYMRAHLGDTLLTVLQDIKDSFDPHNLFNPGKIIDDDRYHIDTNLRQGPGRTIPMPFKPVLAFVERDESFIANLEQCNGCGGCRKLAATMCPTFLATGDELMSTRGRANLIRAALENRGRDFGDALQSEEMEAALSNCLACKACTTECPSNVNMALLKAELMYARHRRHGLPLTARMISNVDLMGRLGCRAPRIANAVLRSRLLRFAASKTIGISRRRPLPRFTRNRFDLWFARRPARKRPPERGRVILWDDTFVRYHEPHVGMAAVKVLETAGYQVELLEGRSCCGRPAFSQGNLDEAARCGRHNIALLNQHVDNAPVVFLEPSCWSMFIEDYHEMRLPGVEHVARRCHLFEEFMLDLLNEEPDALRFRRQDTRVVIHSHCHVKALRDPQLSLRLARRLPERQVILLDTGCCGMAGAFGATASKYELSLKVAAPLIQQITHQPFGTPIVASGTSCRQQIAHLAHVKLRHMAELLVESLVRDES